MPAMTHIAGAPIQIGSRLRQRCGWCGATLIDLRLERVAVPVGQDPAPGTWQQGRLVLVDGNASYLLDQPEGSEIPGDCCARIDDAVTA
jgi:hypothetical protein